MIENPSVEIKDTTLKRVSWCIFNKKNFETNWSSIKNRENGAEDYNSCSEIYGMIFLRLLLVSMRLAYKQNSTLLGFHRLEMFSRQPQNLLLLKIQSISFDARFRCSILENKPLFDVV
jgi:hypothetical protein